MKDELRRLRARVSGMVVRLVLDAVNEGLKTSRLKVSGLDGDVDEDVELLQPYGFHISPPPGCEAIGLSVSGSRSNMVAICPHHPDQRPKGAKSKTGGLYTTGEWRLFIDEDGVVHVGAEVGAEFIALADKTDDRIEKLQGKVDDILTALSSIAAADSVSGPCVFAPWVATLPTPLGTQTSVAATKAKAT